MVPKWKWGQCDKMSEKIRVLFICLGNICRSPAAETLFAHHVASRSMDDLFEIDSCGTGGWHAGERADERMRSTAIRHNLEITHRARQIKSEDFEIYDYLLVMDYQNLADVKALNQKMSHKVAMITDYSRDFTAQIIPDPYFGDMEGFENVFTLLKKVTGQVADTIIHKHSAKS